MIIIDDIILKYFYSKNIFSLNYVIREYDCFYIISYYVI